MKDLNFPTRDQMCALCPGNTRVLTPEPPGKFLSSVSHHSEISVTLQPSSSLYTQQVWVMSTLTSKPPSSSPPLHPLSLPLDLDLIILRWTYYNNLPVVLPLCRSSTQTDLSFLRCKSISCDFSAQDEVQTLQKSWQGFSWSEPDLCIKPHFSLLCHSFLHSFI